MIKSGIVTKPLADDPKVDDLAASVERLKLQKEYAQKAEKRKIEEMKKKHLKCSEAAK